MKGRTVVTLSDQYNTTIGDRHKFNLANVKFSYTMRNES